MSSWILAVQGNAVKVKALMLLLQQREWTTMMELQIQRKRRKDETMQRRYAELRMIRRKMKRMV
jgi:steroid 5-alpha reductase family enzyme